MDQIKFNAGLFKSFTATRSFALASFGSVEKGSELEFDGSTVKYAGTDYSFPQLRAAIAAGWIVLSGDYDAENSDYGRPVAANIQVRSATQGDQPRSMIATVEQDEHVVMNSREHASSTRAGNHRTASQPGSEGVPVRKLKSPAISATNVVSAQAVISELNNLKITPGRGMTVDEMLERMTDAEREDYLAKKDMAKAAYIESAGTSSSSSGSGTIVSTVKSASTRHVSEGVTVTQTTGGGVETWDGEGASVVATLDQDKVTVVEDGISFTTTGIPGPKSARKPGAGSRAAYRTDKVTQEPLSVRVRLRIAKAMCADFPDTYDFGATDRKKLARLQADFEDRPDVLRAVFAAEGDEFRARLVQEFPQAFA